MNRSMQGALEVLRANKAQILDSVADPAAKALLTDELIEAVLELAWEHQFNEDRSAFKTEVQKLVSDAIEARFLAESKK